jgi:hypothetical protein
LFPSSSEDCECLKCYESESDGGSLSLGLRHYHHSWLWGERTCCPARMERGQGCHLSIFCLVPIGEKNKQTNKKECVNSVLVPRVLLPRIEQFSCLGLVFSSHLLLSLYSFLLTSPLALFNGSQCRFLRPMPDLYFRNQECSCVDGCPGHIGVRSSSGEGQPTDLQTEKN